MLDQDKLVRFAPGLVDILRREPSIVITEGNVSLEPYDYHRVFSWITRYGKEGQIAMFLYQGNKKVNDGDIADILGVGRNKLKRAFPEDLARIGMRPDYCHPFPDFNLVKKGTISHMVLDNGLYRMTEDAFSPIYGETGRVASVSMLPSRYMDVVSSIASEGVGIVDTRVFTNSR